MQFKVKPLVFNSQLEEGSPSWVARGIESDYEIWFSEDKKQFKSIVISDYDSHTFFGYFDTLEEAKKAANEDHVKEVNYRISKYVNFIAKYTEGN